MLRVLLAFIFVVLSSQSRAADGVNSQVFVLADLSSSYFSKGSGEMRRRMVKLSAALSDKVRGPDKPFSVHVLLIGDVSQTKKPVCAAELARKNLFGRQPKCSPGLQCFSKEEDFSIFMDLCGDTLDKMATQPATDITGALSLVSSIKSSDPYKPKYLFIFSDMEEKRKPIPTSKINLTGFKINILCPQADSTGSSTDCEKDIVSKWEDVFKSYGVKRLTATLDVPTVNWIEQGLLE